MWSIALVSMIHYAKVHIEESAQWVLGWDSKVETRLVTAAAEVLMPSAGAETEDCGYLESIWVLLSIAMRLLYWSWVKASLLNWLSISCSYH